MPGSRPLVVCDRNIPFAAEAFGTFARVVLRDGRAISRDDVREADALVTRSTTRVGAPLLDGSRVRFYGSTVIGTDHIDEAWLAQAGIPWTAAPGCNARSVAEYVAAALLCLARRHRFTLAGRTLGIVGVGHVGRRVAALAPALGLSVIACDPPRQRNPADHAAAAFVPLHDLLAAADIVSLHVPLTREGPDAALRLLDAAACARLRPGSIVINACRGEVVDTPALLAALGPRVAHAVIDTWWDEPRIGPELLARADLATPHIAGHSYEGKVNGLMQVYRAACAAFGVSPSFEPTLPPPPVPRIDLDATGLDDQAAADAAVRRVYDIEADDAALRATLPLAPDARAETFDNLRRRYPIRREFAATAVRLTAAGAALQARFDALGFARAP